VVTSSRRQCGAEETGLPALQLRPETAQDHELVVAIYASTRAVELAHVPWSEADKERFVRQQSAAQQAHYHAHYHGARFDIVEADGVPVGRLYQHRGPRDLRIMDITILPAHRGRGLGTRLLGALLDEGAALGCLVSIHVERENPALRLYQRLGFVCVEDKGLHLLLHRTPSVGAEGASRA
jgi:ribosomal protein S18 acetylase RimI-like enzyme